MQRSSLEQENEDLGKWTITLGQGGDEVSEEIIDVANDLNHLHCIQCIVTQILKMDVDDYKDPQRVPCHVTFKATWFSQTGRKSFPLKFRIILEHSRPLRSIGFVKEVKPQGNVISANIISLSHSTFFWYGFG